MKTQAAIAIAARRAPEFLGVDLEGARAGERGVEIKANRMCHAAQFTCSDADPEGLFPAFSMHDDPDIGVGVRPGLNIAFDLTHCFDFMHGVVQVS